MHSSEKQQSQSSLPAIIERMKAIFQRVERACNGGSVLAKESAPIDMGAHM